MLSRGTGEEFFEISEDVKQDKAAENGVEGVVSEDPEQEKTGPQNQRADENYRIHFPVIFDDSAHESSGHADRGQRVERV